MTSYMTPKKAQAYIIAGAALWGGIGVFFNFLSDLGFTPMQIVAIRVFCAAAAFILWLLLTGHLGALRIAPRDGIYFIGTGIFSLIFFNWCYFNAISASSLAVAAVLLYTSPVWLMGLSAIFFKEKLTTSKIIATILTLTGCALVAGILGDSAARLSLKALLLGLGSGFGYALYSVFGKFALQKYSPVTVSAHTFIFAAVGVLPFVIGQPTAQPYISLPVLLAGCGIGVLCCLLPFLLYTKGLEYTEAGRAGILATAEPAVATLLGALLFQQLPTLPQIAGMLLIFSAIVLLGRNSK